MWYVIQVQTGNEQLIISLCRRILKKDIYQECFIPKYERMIRQQGKMKKIQKVLFPGYVFIATEQVEKVVKNLQLIPEFTKVLGSDVCDYVPLSQEEEEFLQKFGREEHIVEMSTGVIVGSQVIVHEGPMKDFHGKIKKIDRHKRIAVIEIEFFGRKTEVSVGLEIIRKE